MITFNPDISTLTQLQGVYSKDEIKYEPMIFSGDIAFCREHGGKLTNYFLDALEESKEFKRFKDAHPDRHIVVDTRVTMTKKHQFPSIPGWHCDDVPRIKGSQPQIDKISDVQHFMTIFSDSKGVSATEFLIEPLSIDIDREHVWNSLDEYLESRENKTRFIKEGRTY